MLPCSLMHPSLACPDHAGLELGYTRAMRGAASPFKHPPLLWVLGSTVSSLLLLIRMVNGKLVSRFRLMIIIIEGLSLLIITNDNDN